MTVNLPESVRDVWLVLRPVIDGHATLGDICGGSEHVTLEDVLLLNIAEDACADAERRARKKT